MEGMGQESERERNEAKETAAYRVKKSNGGFSVCYTKAGKPKEEEEKEGYNLQCGERRFMWP